MDENDLGKQLISQLAQARITEKPWRFCHLPSIIPMPLAKTLSSSFADFDLTLCEERDRAKSYQFRTARLDGDSGVELPDEAWAELVDAVSSDGYRRAVGELMDARLDDAQTTLSVWEYQAGNWLAPHLDKPEKMVTQIFYLGSDWREGDGGRLFILDDQSSESVVHTVSPVLGSCAILLRSEDSWHSVEGPSEGAAPRRSFTVTFWKEGGDR